VRVGLENSRDFALLEIVDNGKGFDEKEAQGRGNGVRNLRQRAESLGGEIEIESVPGRGTSVRLRIPL